MEIYSGLTFANTKLAQEVNVHFVINDLVYWCSHPLGNDETGSLYKTKIDNFKMMAQKAIENKNVIFYSLIDTALGNRRILELAPSEVSE